VAARVPESGVVLGSAAEQVVTLMVVRVGLEQSRVLGVITLLLLELSGNIAVNVSSSENGGWVGVRAGGDGSKSSKSRDNGGNVGEHDDNEVKGSCWWYEGRKDSRWFV